jgi:hypothetical protein
LGKRVAVPDRLPEKADDRWAYEMKRSVLPAPVSCEQADIRRIFPSKALVGKPQPYSPPTASSGRCPQCGESFDSSSLRQIYCSRACNIAHHNASRNKTPAKTKAKPLDESFRTAADGLFCRTCGKPIDSREGWRLDHKTCARERMLALHHVTDDARLADDEDNP